MIDQIRQFLREQFPAALISEESFRSQTIFRVRPESLYQMVERLHLHDAFGIKMLADITCVDWLGHERESEGRFELVYNLQSVHGWKRFFLLTRLPAETPTIKSLVPIFQGANWMEREVWDLFGITFEGHPDLTKILTPDELEGHPLRKDYPLTWEQPVFSWNKNDPPEVIK